MPIPLLHTVLSWFLKKRVHQIELFLKYPHEVQQEVLQKLITQAKNTRYKNAGQDFRVHGVEFSLNIPVIDNLEINANYTFTELKDKIAVRIPKHKANMTVVYKVSNGVQLSTSYQYTGTRTDLVSGNKVSLNPYHLWDFTSRYSISNSSILIHMSIHNILDDQYEEIKGFTTLGRNLRLGVEIPF